MTDRHEISKKFIEDYGMTMKEFADKEGLSQQFVRARYASRKKMEDIGKHRVNGTIVCGKPISEIVEQTGLTYNQIYNRWRNVKKKGREITFEELTTKRNRKYGASAKLKQSRLTEAEVAKVALRAIGGF